MASQLTKKASIYPNPKISTRRISGRFVLLWWLLSLGFPAVFLIYHSVKFQNSYVLYTILWLFFTLGLLIFMRHWSFSAVLSRPLDILEIPVYLGLTSMFLIQAFGIVPYFDAQYLRILSSVADLPSGLVLTGIGLFSMLFGYALISRSSKPVAIRPMQLFYDSPSLSLSLFVYVSLLSLRLALIANGTGEMLLTSNVIRLGGDWYQWFVYLVELRWFFIALVTLQVVAGRWPKPFFIFVILLESTMAVISGWSSLLPKIVWLVLGCVLYTRQKIPWRALIPMAVVVIALVIFSIPVARSIRFSGQITWSNINSSVEETWGEGLRTGWKLFSDLVIGRQTLIAQTPSILINLIPAHIPYLPLKELLVAPITFIPRVLWPAKPVYTGLGSWLTVQILGGRETDGSAAVTIAGNAYMYGGWPVVIISMFLIGALAASMYRWLAIPGLLNGQVGLLAVYAGMVIANFHLGEGDFVSIWQGLIQRIVVFLVVAWILCAKIAGNLPNKFKTNVS